MQKMKSKKRTSNLNCCIMVEQNVARLDVTMNLAIGMKVFKTFQYIEQYSGNSCLVQNTLSAVFAVHFVLDDVQQRTYAQMYRKGLSEGDAFQNKCLPPLSHFITSHSSSFTTNEV